MLCRLSCPPSRILAKKAANTSWIALWGLSLSTILYRRFKTSTQMAAEPLAPAPPIAATSHRFAPRAQASKKRSSCSNERITEARLLPKSAERVYQQLQFEPVLDLQIFPGPIRRKRRNALLQLFCYQCAGRQFCLITKKINLCIYRHNVGSVLGPWLRIHRGELSPQEPPMVGQVKKRRTIRIFPQPIGPYAGYSPIPLPDALQGSSSL